MQSISALRRHFFLPADSTSRMQQKLFLFLLRGLARGGFLASLFQELRYQFVVLFKMRTDAAGAVLDALLGISKTSSAFIAQEIQRAVAEKAVEVLRIGAFVAREIFALFMREILVIIAFYDGPAAFRGLFLLFVHMIIIFPGAR